MVALIDLPCQPNGDAVQAFLHRLFAHAGQRGLIELSWTATKAPHKLEHARLYDLADLDELGEFAAAQNLSPNRNVYVSAGLRREGADRRHRATDRDVLACVALWADFDAAGGLSSAIAAAERAQLTPSIIVHTGHEPHLRGQLWWILEEPCGDMVQHMRLMRALTRALGGDPSIVNPSRVMRIAGSVAWPLKAGRQLEITALDEETDTRANPYSLEEIEQKLERMNAFVAEPTAQVLDFNAAEPQLDLDDLVLRAKQVGLWHKSALQASAHLLGRGTPPDVTLDMLTPLLRQPGYTNLQTRNDLRTMIDGALKRGIYQSRDVEPPLVDVPVSGASSPLKSAPLNPFQSIDQLIDMPPVEWIIENYLPELGMSALYGPPGVFKSFVALDMGLSVAYGLPWHGMTVKQRRVLYVCAEGQHGLGTRALVWREHRAQGQRTDQFHVLPVPVNFLDPACVEQLITAISAHLGGVGLTIIDTLARNFGTGDENSTKDMKAYIDGAAMLIAMGSHVCHVHHSGKDDSKDERGSSAFRGALDTVLKLHREPGADLVTLYMQKQKDAPEALPMRLTVPIAEGVHPRTGEIVTSRVPTVAAVLGEGAMDPADARAGLSTLQLKLLDLIGAGVSSVSILTSEAGTKKTNVTRALARLFERGLARSDENGFWKLIEQKEEEIQCAS